MTLVIPHIPKTGGQSLRHHFAEYFEFNSEFVHLGPWGEDQLVRRELTPWINKDLESRRCAKIIFGHYVYSNEILNSFDLDEIAFATCLRDPAKRWISQFNFEVALGQYPNISQITFWEYFNIKNNPAYMLNYLWHVFMKRGNASTDEKIKGVVELLAKFKYVGMLENYDAYSDWVTDYLKIPKVKKAQNVSSARNETIFKPTEEDLEKLRTICYLDYELIDQLSLSGHI